MKILPQQIQNIVGAYRKSAGPADNASAPATRTDEVELSERAGELSRARQAYDGLPDARAVRVAALRERIRNGTYRLDDDDIADAILNGAPASRWDDEEE
jgi:flagellar biosynthesis anti-sigma factor FlgM